MISRHELPGAADPKVTIFPSREGVIPFLEENNAWGFVRIGQNPEYVGMYITGDVGAVMYVARITEIVPSLIKRNTGEVAILLGDKGYDDQKIRALVREKDIRLLIKHREFSPVHKAGNARLDADLYGQRSQNETVNSRLKRKYGALIRSRAIDPSRGIRVALSPLKW